MISIWSWKRSVYSALIQLKLENIINDKLSRPSENNPNYKRWRSWSTVVGCWLLNQLHPDVIEGVEQFSKRFEIEVDLEDRIPRCTDDLYTLICK